MADEAFGVRSMNGAPTPIASFVRPPEPGISLVKTEDPDFYDVHGVILLNNTARNSRITDISSKYDPH